MYCEMNLSFVNIGPMVHIFALSKEGTTLVMLAKLLLCVRLFFESRYILVKKKKSFSSLQSLSHEKCENCFRKTI